MVTPEKHPWSNAWDFDILELWILEILVSWNLELLTRLTESWNLEVLKSWTLELLNSLGLLKSWNLETQTRVRELSDKWLQGLHRYLQMLPGANIHAQARQPRAILPGAWHKNLDPALLTLGQGGRGISHYHDSKACHMSEPASGKGGQAELQEAMVDWCLLCILDLVEIDFLEVLLKCWEHLLQDFL